MDVSPEGHKEVQLLSADSAGHVSPNMCSFFTLNELEITRWDEHVSPGEASVCRCWELRVSTCGRASAIFIYVSAVFSSSFVEIVRSNHQ